MENASKALLMAGGVLIAIVTIAFLVKSLSTVQQFQMSQLSAEEQEQLTAFNEQYTKYVGQYVYGTEVITLQNKYGNDRLVEVDVEGEQPDVTDNKYNYNSATNSYSNKTRYYKCTKVEYDNMGKVNKIYFKQINLSASTTT